MPTFDEQLGDQRRFAFASTAVPAGTFGVVKMEGIEALSQPYEFTLTLIAERADVPVETLLNRSATFTIYGKPGGAPVPYHGVIRACEQLHQAGPYTLYRVVLVPRLWRLSRSRESEVYVGMTIPQMIERVLTDAGLGGDNHALQLNARYKVWSYYCQYQETNFAFISRLMERVGIYYFFEQSRGAEKLRLVDSLTFHDHTKQVVPYLASGDPALAKREGGIQAFVCKQEPMPKQIVLQDYNYEKAAMELTAEAAVGPNGIGEERIFGEHYENPEEGRRLADIRAQEFLCRRIQFYGEGAATGLRAGYFFQLDRHYRTDFNATYLTTRVRHEGSQAAALFSGLIPEGQQGEREPFYRQEFTAIPAATQFRPERRTPSPRIEGTISAFVDAEGSGQYAEIDDQGRYKVQVPFDKTDKQAGKASTWIRKTSQYSGKDHGMHYPLHKGTEVLLSFVNGDLNQPVIVGAVHNSETPNIVTRVNQTQTVLHTGGSNRMVMEDLIDNEHIHLNTPKANTILRMGTGMQSTVGAQAAGASTDGFTFNTDANWTVSATDASTTLKSDTLKVTGTQTETIGQREVTLGSPLSSLTDAGNYVPLIGSAIESPISKMTIYGAESQTVIGKSAKTVIGIQGDMFIGVAGNLYVVLPGKAQVPLLTAAGHMYFGEWIDMYVGVGGKMVIGTERNTNLGPVTEFVTSKLHVAGEKLEQVGQKLEAVGSKIKSFGQEVVARVQSLCSTQTNIEATEIEMTELGTRVGTTGVNVDETETEVRSSEVRVDETATDIKSGDIEMTTFGVTMIG
ncbi:MAG: type VI secretion system tip protein VgrG [Nitrospira sp.]|nr:type VI secretion system tip protein VgrG [Nitrospira sp.]